jgi:hypothetical protein
MPVTCPRCSSDSVDLVERLGPYERRLRCEACGHDWLRFAQAAAGKDQAARDDATRRKAARGRPDPPLLIVDDDAAYIAWVQRHAWGYVIDCSRRPSAEETMMLHRAGCPTVTGHPTQGPTWTGGVSAKVCAQRRADLVGWAEANVRSKPTPCEICNP